MSILYPERHTFLEKELTYNFNQKVISRVIDRFLEIKTSDRDERHGFPKLSTQVPVIHAPNVDITRARKAYGNWALPKLKKELHHPDLITVMQALRTIDDEVHNPEKTFEAIRLGIVERLIDLMTHEKDFIREKVCMIFYTLAGQEVGRRAIIKRYRILKNLAYLLEDKTEGIQHKAAMTTDMLSRSFTGRDALIAANFPILLLRLIGGNPRIENEEILILLLATLDNLLWGDIKAFCLEHNALNILLEKVRHPREEIRGHALSCISLLCWDTDGKLEAVDKDVIVSVGKKLFEEDRKVNSKAAAAVTFASIKNEGRVRGTVQCILDRLVELLEDFHSRENQLMAAKALANIADVPAAREYLKNEKILGRIEGLYTGGNQHVERHRDILLDVINWEP